MTRQERLSVRELIVALARLEDELRVAGPSVDDADLERRLAAREAEILQELRRRGPDFVCGADPAVSQGSSPVTPLDASLERPLDGAGTWVPLLPSGESAEEPLPGDPHTGGVGDAAEGDDPGQRVLGAGRVPQDDVGGAARDRA